jgi:hypothetical protein
VLQLKAGHGRNQAGFRQDSALILHQHCLQHPCRLFPHISFKIKRAAQKQSGAVKTGEKPWSKAPTQGFLQGFFEAKTTLHTVKPCQGHQSLYT